MKHNILIITALLVGLAACEKVADTGRIETADGSMTFEFLYPSAVTRATSEGFEAGDRIGLYATEYNGAEASPLEISGNWANNIATSFDGSSWTPEKKIFWSDSTMDVYAYYPYMSPTSIVENRWAVQNDQSTAKTDSTMAGYEASDFLWAKAKGVRQSDGTVSLAFAHKCSRLVIKLEKGKEFIGDFATESELYVHNTVTEAYVDFTSGSVSKYIFGEDDTIKARKVDDGTFEAIIVPQRVDSRRPFIEYIAGGVSYMVEDTFNFKPGKSYTYTLTLSTNPESIAISIGGSVSTDW